MKSKMVNKLLQRAGSQVMRAVFEGRHSPNLHTIEVKKRNNK
jgi:hypothetical protein